MKINKYIVLSFLLNFNTFSEDEDNNNVYKDEKTENNDNNNEKFGDSFWMSTTNKEVFNKINKRIDYEVSFNLLNSSYIAESKNLKKYSSLKLDKPLIRNYLAINQYFGFKYNKLCSIGIRFGSAGLSAGNFIQYNLMAALSHKGLMFAKKAFSITGELGFGIYFYKSKNEKLKKIADVVEKENFQSSFEKFFINILFGFYWNFIGISFGGPVSLRFLNDNNELEDKINRIINIINLAFTSDNKLKQDEYKYLKERNLSRFIGLLDFLNLKVSINVTDLAKFIIQKKEE